MGDSEGPPPTKSGGKITSAERKPQGPRAQHSLDGAGPRLAREHHQSWDMPCPQASRAQALSRGGRVAEGLCPGAQSPLGSELLATSLEVPCPTPSGAWPQQLVFTTSPVLWKSTRRRSNILSWGTRGTKSLISGPAWSGLVGSAEGSAQQRLEPHPQPTGSAPRERWQLGGPHKPCWALGFVLFPTGQAGGATGISRGPAERRVPVLLPQTFTSSQEEAPQAIQRPFSCMLASVQPPLCAFSEGCVP